MHARRTFEEERDGQEEDYVPATRDAFMRHESAYMRSSATVVEEDDFSIGGSSGSQESVHDRPSPIRWWEDATTHEFEREGKVGERHDTDMRLRERSGGAANTSKLDRETRASGQVRHVAAHSTREYLTDDAIASIQDLRSGLETPTARPSTSRGGGVHDALQKDHELSAAVSSSSRTVWPSWPESDSIALGQDLVSRARDRGSGEYDQVRRASDQDMKRGDSSSPVFRRAYSESPQSSSDASLSPLSDDAAGSDVDSQSYVIRPYRPAGHGNNVAKPQVPAVQPAWYDDSHDSTMHAEVEMLPQQIGAVVHVSDLSAPESSADMHDYVYTHARDTAVDSRGAHEKEERKGMASQGSEIHATSEESDTWQDQAYASDTLRPSVGDESGYEQLHDSTATVHADTARIDKMQTENHMGRPPVAFLHKDMLAKIDGMLSQPWVRPATAMSGAERVQEEDAHRALFDIKNREEVRICALDIVPGDVPGCLQAYIHQVHILIYDKLLYT
jgi:hypothetical protein